MSRFYITATNERDKAINKAGRKELVAHIRGWNKGLKIEAFIDDDGLDTFRIYETGGSNAPDDKKYYRSLTDKKSAGPRNPKGQLK